MNNGFRGASFQIEVQKPVFKRCAGHIDTLRKHETALKLTRRDAPVQETPLPAVIGLAAPDHQLARL